MHPEPSPTSWRTSAAGTIAAAAPAVLLLADRTHWEWLAPWLGRFHPVVLHFPIALLLMAGLLEVLQLAGRGRWRFPVTFILFWGSFSATAAMALGWHLMAADEVTGTLADQHRQGGILVAILAVVTLGVRLMPVTRHRRAGRWSYRVLLLATCALLFRTSHDGAALTHGEDYLTAHAPWRKPAPIPAFAFPTEKPVMQWDVYAHVVTPILQARCYECHGTNNAKGGLKLDSLAGLQHGGKNGVTVVAGQPEKSSLLVRMNLPPDHKEHMPPRRKPQPSPEELALLRRWVALGAQAQGTLGDLKFDNRLLAVVGQLPALLQTGTSAAEAEVKEIDPAAVAAERAGLSEIVLGLQAKHPHVLAYQSRQSADLELNAALLGRSFGDAELAAFLPLGNHLVWADFTGTAITDLSAPSLATLKKLRVLRLGRTAITDVTVAQLAGLEELNSLNVFGTAITPQSLAVLERFRGLQRIYVGETSIPESAPSPDSLRAKLHFIQPAPVLPPPPPFAPKPAKS